jgi:hypothetical protein
VLEVTDGSGIGRRSLQMSGGSASNWSSLGAQSGEREGEEWRGRCGSYRCGESLKRKAINREITASNHRRYRPERRGGGDCGRKKVLVLTCGPKLSVR